MLCPDLLQMSQNERIAPRPGLFLDTHRSSRGLPHALANTVLEGALHTIGRFEADELDGRSDAQVAEAVFNSVWDPPSLGEMWIGPPESAPRQARPGATQNSSFYVDAKRIPLEWPVEGASDWLDLWPEGADKGLTPVDKLDGEPDLEDPDWHRDWNRLVERAHTRFVREGSVVKGYVDIPRDDPRPPIQARDEDVAAENELLGSYVEAIRESAELYRPDFMHSLVEAVSERRRELAWVRDLAQGLELMPAPSSLVLEVVSDDDQESHTVDLPPFQLTEPSRLALLKAIRYWSQKVEQYPASFRKLGEDDLSNLLAATLALAFGVADREVFCRSGRTDIYVPMAALRELKGIPSDASEGSAFVAEAKKGSGPTLANDAKIQLDGYIPISAAHAALLFYVSAHDGIRATDRILQGLRGRSDYIGDAALDGSPYPLLNFAHTLAGSTVSVAIITIHLGDG